ncbi:hypothetical protein L1887_31245 [Cichorium endivia]|nr:hypothetical protein L1887_31245 [Cichorium endivia]
MKGYRDNGGAAGGFGARNKTVYDDVFGGPPKFGATTLPPRLEDYTEIFQGFHASRGSSIPVLDLPPPCNDSDDVWFDVQSSKLDYSEVFGGFNGLDFAVSYEELFKSSKVADGDSSDDIWTPAQSESLSDELDPYTSLEMNQHISTSDPIELFGVQLHKEPEKDLLNGITNDSHFLENEKLFSLANKDHSSSNHIEKKVLKKSFSQPLDSFSDTEKHKQHLFVSDVSLKTQPSNLPPPSRPPPVLSSKKGDDTCFSSKLKTSKSYAFEKMNGDRSPPYFDVEIDASSSAAVDAAAMKDAVQQAQAKLKSVKELMDRKKEGLQSRSKGKIGNVNYDERSNEFVDKNKKDDFKIANEIEGLQSRLKMQMKINGEGKMGNVNDDERPNEFIDMNKKDDFKNANEIEGLQSWLDMEMKNNVEGKMGNVNDDEKSNDFKNVEEREVCGFEEKNERQETADEIHSGHEDIKEPDLVQDRGAETSFVVSQEHGESKTASEGDENESYDIDNLIEIQLKDNDIEDGVILVGENDENTPYDWEDYGEAFQKEHEKEVKEPEEQVGPPEIVITTQSEEEEDDDNHESEEHEEGMSQNEKILHEEDEINADVANETDSNSEENKELQKDHEREEEIEKREEVVFENYVVEELTEEDEVVVDQVDENVKVKVEVEVKVKEETSMEEKLEREKMERENERIRKLEEERERQIEREKDRMAMDRATLEARERAFSEIKERSERAAVERATAEFRQRALAEARERLEKACAEARERSLADKAMEGRLRVEKATAEARERAERSVDDKFLNSRSMGLRFPQNSAAYNEGEGESPQRCKARLERHQRTADRAAKALAEKNMRDLLAQKEQAERNRLAEGLDAEVKRWCGGKQGNLRALLSTLQYILGPDSGWQPVPLTEVITTAAVKKAYRKATLCVHPDKLQQRGATIQQKYICEKVFDLLKEAWNKFNSEER